MILYLDYSTGNWKFSLIYVSEVYIWSGVSKYTQESANNYPIVSTVDQAVCDIGPL